MAPMKCLKVQVSDSILEMPGTWVKVLYFNKLSLLCSNLLDLATVSMTIQDHL